MTDLLETLPPAQQDKLRPAEHPSWIGPMLATLTHDHFSDAAWLFERKLDGQRCLAFRDRHRLRLRSRTQQTLDRTYPEIVDALERQPCPDFVVDGEIVAFDEDRPSFSRLQRRLGITNPDVARRSHVAVFFYLFDLLHVDGYDTRELPLRTRKRLLLQAISFEAPLRFTSHRNEAGEGLLREMCAKRWEGVIAKKADSRYVSRRSSDWLKFKCSAGQELVVGGFTEPSGSRIGLGALLVGYYDGGDLIYAGKVGTGYDRQTLQDLRGRLDAIETDDPPFAGDVKEPRAHWTKPELVAEIAFTEWTTDGKLRHPRFIGLLHDKKPTDVVRERPA